MTGNAHNLGQEQLQLLRMVAASASGTAVAERLNCSMATVAQRMADIRALLNVGSTAQAVDVARVAGCW